MSLDRCGAIADALRLSPPPFDSPASRETEPGEAPHPQRKPRRNAIRREADDESSSFPVADAALHRLIRQSSGRCGQRAFRHGRKSISTRRFARRPASVALLATYPPVRPKTLTFMSSTPRPTKYCLAATARCNATR